jgi:hypothetical protein
LEKISKAAPHSGQSFRFNVGVRMLDAPGHFAFIPAQPFIFESWPHYIIAIAHDQHDKDGHFHEQRDIISCSINTISRKTVKDMNAATSPAMTFLLTGKKPWAQWEPINRLLKNTISNRLFKNVQM